jgi:hypothetical protein
MSTQVSRREFLKIIFATAPAVALAHQLPFWPDSERSRPISEPAEIGRDEYDYLVDPGGIDFGSWPTRQGYFELDDASDEEIHKWATQEQDISGIVSDPENWSVSEIRCWLEENVELDEISRYAAAEICGYGDGIALYEKLGRERAEDLGLQLVDGCHPGSDFLGVNCSWEVAEVNQALLENGLNLVVVEV